MPDLEQTQESSVETSGIRPYVKKNLLIPDLWDDESSTATPVESPRVSPAEAPREISPVTQPESRKYLEQSDLLDRLWHSTSQKKKSADEASWDFLIGVAVGGVACMMLRSR